MDVLAKAKTGTGKTLAFLIPAIERAAKDRNNGISALIISPTRELAQQIAAEAEQVSMSNMQYGGPSRTGTGSKRFVHVNFHIYEPIGPATRKVLVGV